MLKINIETKQELIKVLQASDVKKIIAHEITTASQLQEFISEARKLISRNGSLTAVLIKE